MHFTGKERDTETASIPGGSDGLDNFGARYDSSSFGRFMTPDPTPMGIDLSDPQAWNLYNYVQNRPTRAVDMNGAWATDIHAQITTFALQNYVSAGDLSVLVHEQYVMDSDQSDQHKHGMANPGDSPQEAVDGWQDYVAQEMADVRNDLTPDGNFTSEALRELGNAIHTLQDTTSPKHTDPYGMPRTWYGKRRPLLALDHAMGEASPFEDWSAIGKAIRYSMDALLESTAGCQRGKTCLTQQNFESEWQKNVEAYFNSEVNSSVFLRHMSEVDQDAMRQCALGNPAACEH